MRSDQFPALRRWRAIEKHHAENGWMPLILGSFAVLWIVAGVLTLIGGTHVDVSLEIGGGPIARPWRGILTICDGLILLGLARGLWNGKSWARWVIVSFLGVGLALEVYVSLRDRQLRLSPLPLALFVYLLLPATARTFRRAREARKT